MHSASTSPPHPNTRSNLPTTTDSAWRSEPREERGAHVTSGFKRGVLGQGVFLTSGGCENLNHSLNLVQILNLSYFIHNKIPNAHTQEHTHSYAQKTLQSLGPKSVKHQRDNLVFMQLSSKGVSLQKKKIKYKYTGKLSSY